MPKFQQSLSLPQGDTESFFLDAYRAFRNLDWQITYADTKTLIGKTPKTWKKYSQQITVSFSAGEMTVESNMTGGESFDITGINKKNTAAFIKAFELARTDEESFSTADYTALQQLRADSVTLLQNELKEAEEVRLAMNPAGSNLYVTYGLIFINVLVFILMALDGAGIMDLNALVHIKWGSNFGPLTLSGDYWRLVTNTFIHFGIIHLVMNMYCLYMIGIYLEPMLGKKKYIAAYFCSGILASLVSLWWHTEAVNSAGASGAIFGMYGLFFALLTTDLIPASVRSSLLKNIGIFIFYNLIYGVKSGVDNAAHIGGLVFGFIFGYIYVIGIRKEKKEERAVWVLPAVLIITAGITVYYLQAFRKPFAERDEILAALGESNFKDTDKFNAKYNEFVALQDKAVAVMSDTTLSNEATKTALNEVSLPAWQQAKTVAIEMKQMNVGKQKIEKANAVLHYIELRIEELDIARRVLDNEAGADSDLASIRERLNNAVDSIK